MPPASLSTQFPPVPPAPPPATNATIVIDTAAALQEEREKLLLGTGVQPAALCLSGGGIRSAAFCLGVIQAFATAGLLKHFHYLSTVSGGGYIGGWLTRLIHTHHHNGKIASLEKIEKKLIERRSGIESDEISALRRYTNYLAPKLGPASADLWSGVLLWLRNTLINWLIFTPLLIALVSLPIIYFLLVAIVAFFHFAHPLQTTAIALSVGIGALGCLGVATFRSIIYLPTHSHPFQAKASKEKFGIDGIGALRLIVAPALLWCLLAPIAAAPLMLPQSNALAPSITSVFLPGTSEHRQTDTNFKAEFGDRIRMSVVVTSPERREAPPTPVAGSPAMLMLIFTSIIITGMAAYLGGLNVVWNYDYRSKQGNFHKQITPFATNLPAWFISCCISAGLNCLGIHLGTGADILWITLAGPFWVLLSEILRSTTYIAFRREALRGDLDREWLARLSGTKLSIVLIGVCAGTLVLLAPRYVPFGIESWSALLGGGAASGTAAALLGKSTQTVLSARKPDGSRWIGTGPIITVAIVIFAASLLLVVGHGVGAVVWHLSNELAGTTLNSVDETRLLVAALLAIVLAAGATSVATRLGSWINLNNFSMHAVYRNRLVRAFLGTARPKGAWRPDRYTHFDPRDDIRMAEAFGRRDPPRLFPVVNVALNCTSGKDMARAERKAESFTITPLRCGSASLLGRGDTPTTAALPRGAYAKTQRYAGNGRESGPTDQEQGISLGTAITISGAAASPNMGYHSSPLIAFVMTLFNVRLGAWLPNPGAGIPDTAYLGNADADTIGPMLSELAGRSDDRGKYVYLSDGGHFDNLALYEMLRRRCRYIVLVDAGQDADYAYADLRMAIQRASVDLGVTITFPTPLRIGDAELDPVGALASVEYPEITDKALGLRTKEIGEILYLKPWLPKDGPAELRAFKVQRKSFPHENTGNQFFTESDFESYRHLGESIGLATLKTYDVPISSGPNHPGRNADALKQFFAGLRNWRAVRSSAGSDPTESRSQVEKKKTISRRKVSPLP